MKLTVLALVMAVTPQTRAAIHRAFRPDEFEILWSATPSEAVKASTQHRPGLVLLDLDQPVRTGRAILDNLRKLNPRAPMVVLANHSSAGEEAIADEGIAILWKPFGATVLADMANALLKEPRSNTAALATNNANVSSAITDSERFHERLLARYNAPFQFTPSDRHWGINE